MEYLFKKVVLSFQRLSVCVGFESFPENKNVCSLCVLEEIKEHFTTWNDAVTTKSSLMQSSCCWPVVCHLAWSQFSLLTRAVCQPKYQLNVSTAKNQKRTEKLFFLFSMVLTPPHALIGHWETFCFWKVEVAQIEENGINFATENSSVQYNSSVSRDSYLN